MKIRVPQASIAGEVAALSGSILSASSALNGSPSGIRMVATADGRLTLAAYNTRDHAEFLVEAKVEEPGELIIAADRTFPALVAGLAGQDLDLSVAKGGTSLLVKTTSGEYSIPTLAGGDWPEFPAASEVSGSATVPTDGLLRGILRASKAADANNSKRPILEGLLLEVNEGALVLSATNGRCISVRQVAAETQGGTGCVVHARSLDVLAKMSKLLTAQPTLAVSVEDGRRVSFEQPGRFRLSCAIMGDQSRFPNIAMVFPEKFDIDLVFDRRELQAAHKRMSLFIADAYATPMVLAFDDLGVLRLSADQNASSLGTASESIASVENHAFVPDGEYRIGLNARMMADGLGLIDGDTVRLRGAGGRTQVMVFTEADAEFPASREFYMATGFLLS